MKNISKKKTNKINDESKMKCMKKDNAKKHKVIENVTVIYAYILTQ